MGYDGDREQAAAALSKKLEALSFTLTPSELAELGGILDAAKVTKLAVEDSATAAGDGTRAFDLDVSAYSQAAACW
jgi:hypothetical protein